MHAKLHETMRKTWYERLRISGLGRDKWEDTCFRK